MTLAAVKNFLFSFLAALTVSVLVNVNLTAAMPPPTADLSAVGNAIQLLAPRNLTQQATCPSTQPETQAGCSTCTECCIFQFNDAGCGQPSVGEYGLNDFDCHPLEIDMNNVWITECTGVFAECMLWKNQDCTGEDSWSIDNTANVCHHTQYWIGAIQCYQSDEKKKLAMRRLSGS
ncbi:uncharacterized protein Z520_03429 [Fonsecaea multimorphosa CBS 102226]|uniref:Chitin-binding type-2 domain-containing protein n=1 Tax=Fonsecaea multimorphosa CBS 102226 TaxID=1442371 RepID=A0A0D2KVH7_9EURO|nr:uncharacterized protein Z520_03429 [Fonsecaea multimorphosa CBS 102226]KIY00764.1 hypothetical protein Z520_03429 [Fonsecaea multimorphosa CBS 102226]OAL27862.1 hypothetical protein AYO22_03207 [Fonsecaea multimorphosa]